MNNKFGDIISCRQWQFVPPIYDADDQALNIETRVLMIFPWHGAISASLDLWKGYDDVIKRKHFPRYWPFVGEFTGHRWISRPKACDAELWCFLWSAPEQIVEQTIAALVIWDAIVLIMTSWLWNPPFTGPPQGTSNAEFCCFIYLTMKKLLNK